MKVALAPHEFMSKMETRMQFTANDRSILKENADWGAEVAAEMTEHFYNYLSSDAEMNAILNEKEGRMEKLHKTFIDWFKEMFTGMDNWGNAYADRRWRIGLIHVRIGIGPQHVVPAMATVMREAEKKMIVDGKNSGLKDSLSKICMIDLAFIEQAYVEVSSSAVLEETGWTEGLFRRLVKTGASSL